MATCKCGFFDHACRCEEQALRQALAIAVEALDWYGKMPPGCYSLPAAKAREALAKIRELGV